MILPYLYKHMKTLKGHQGLTIKKRMGLNLYQAKILVNVQGKTPINILIRIKMVRVSVFKSQRMQKGFKSLFVMDIQYGGSSNSSKNT